MTPCLCPLCGGRPETFTLLDLDKSGVTEIRCHCGNAFVSVSHERSALQSHQIAIAVWNGLHRLSQQPIK